MSRTKVFRVCSVYKAVPSKKGASTARIPSADKRQPRAEEADVGHAGVAGTAKKQV